jgi:hypothetical protein
VALPGAYAPSGIALGIMGSTRPSHNIGIFILTADNSKYYERLVIPVMKRGKKL